MGVGMLVRRRIGMGVGHLLPVHIVGMHEGRATYIQVAEGAGRQQSKQTDVQRIWTVVTGHRGGLG